MASQETFKTPAKIKEPRRNSAAWTEVIVPKSPMLKLLGYGTGIKVSLLDRGTPRRVTVRSPWAVKRLSRRSHIEPAHAERLARDADVLRRLRHPNVVGYRGVVPGPAEGTLSLLMEAASSSLYDLIEARMESGEPVRPFPLRHIVAVGEDVASALHYLHVEQHLLHGDMKSGNVLIFGNFDTAKVCDFGVALPLDKDLVVSEPRQFYVGTEAWSAPEAIHDGVISHKTDIYAYALTLWEMFSIEVPHASELPDWESSGYSESDDSATFSNSYYDSQMGVAPAVPQYGAALMAEYRPFVELYTVCSTQDPVDRPSAEHCRSIFKDIRQRLSHKRDTHEESYVGDETSFDVSYSDDETTADESSFSVDAGDDSVVVLPNEPAPRRHDVTIDLTEDKENDNTVASQWMYRLMKNESVADNSAGSEKLPCAASVTQVSSASLKRPAPTPQERPLKRPAPTRQQEPVKRPSASLKRPAPTRKRNR